MMSLFLVNLCSCVILGGCWSAITSKSSLTCQSPVRMKFESQLLVPIKHKINGNGQWHRAQWLINEFTKKIREHSRASNVLQSCPRAHPKNGEIIIFNHVHIGTSRPERVSGNFCPRQKKALAKKTTEFPTTMACLPRDRQVLGACGSYMRWSGTIKNPLLCQPVNDMVLRCQVRIRTSLLETLWAFEREVQEVIRLFKKSCDQLQQWRWRWSLEGRNWPIPRSLSKPKKTMNTSSRRLPTTRRKKQPTISKPGKGSNNIMFSQQQHRRGRYRNRNRQKLNTSLRKKMRTKKTCLLQIQTEQNHQVAHRLPTKRTMMNVQRNSLNFLNWKKHRVRDDFKLKRSKQKLCWRWQKPNYSNLKLLHSSRRV